MDSEDEARYTLYFDELLKVDPIDDDAEQLEAFCAHMAAKVRSSLPHPSCRRRR